MRLQNILMYDRPKYGLCIHRKETFHYFFFIIFAQMCMQFSNRME